MKNIILKKYCLLVVFLLFSSFSVLAEEPVMTLTKGIEPGDHLWKIILSLVFILVLIFVSAWLLKRFGRVNGLASNNMQVLANMSVGQRERIILLQVGEEQLLLGVTSSKINLLHELKVPIDVDKKFGSSSYNLTENFASKLQDAMKSKQEKSY